MAEVMFTFMLFLVAMIFAAILFAGWVLYSIFHFIFRMISSVIFPVRRPQRSQIQAMAPSKVCPNIHCRQTNPTVAHYCRRCGQPLPGSPNMAAARTAFA